LTNREYDVIIWIVYFLKIKKMENKLFESNEQNANQEALAKWREAEQSIKEAILSLDDDSDDSQTLEYLTGTLAVIKDNISELSGKSNLKQNKEQVGGRIIFGGDKYEEMRKKSWMTKLRKEINVLGYVKPSDEANKRKPKVTILDPSPTKIAPYLEKNEINA